MMAKTLLLSGVHKILKTDVQQFLKSFLRIQILFVDLFPESTNMRFAIVILACFVAIAFAVPVPDPKPGRGHEEVEIVISAERSDSGYGGYGRRERNDYGGYGQERRGRYCGVRCSFEF
jgi:hypothetical protein